MYLLPIVLLLLSLSVLKVSAQEESTPSSTIEPSITLSVSNKPEQDDEAHLRNQLRKLDDSPTDAPAATKIPPTEIPVTTAPSLIPGDANEDNRVDEEDFAIWHSFYKKPVTGKHTQGDFNNDSITDGMDYTIWLANLGTIPTSTQAPFIKGDISPTRARFPQGPKQQ